MSAQDIQTLQKAYEDLSSDDFESWLELSHPDVELYELAELPGSAVYRGHDGLRQWFDGTRELVDEWQWSLEALVRDRNPYVARVRLTVVGRESSVPIEQVVYHLFEMRDGKAAAIRGFLDEGQALASAEEVDQ